MEHSLKRPPKELIKKAYDYLFNSGMTLPKLRDHALADQFLPPVDDLVQIPGRSIAWKLLLFLEEPLRSPLPLRSATILDYLRPSRRTYVHYLCRHMRAPDGSYDENFVPPGTFASEAVPPRKVENLETNNPLSLHKENPWKEWFAAVELRKTILQDVERTFPDILFFRNSEVHIQLSNILFLYSVMNPSIGYRQGMHEILAPLYYSVVHDSIAEDSDFGAPEMRELCSTTWVAADAWLLFDKVMRGLSKCYEWREPLHHRRGRDSSSLFIPHADTMASSGSLELKPFIAPVVDICNRIQSDLLQCVDPVLWRHMQTTGIEPQIYGIRWLRLLFTREFSLGDALKLWDGLFASDPSLELAQWVCVAMLIRIRNELLSADYSTQVMILLRYPSPETLPIFDGAAYHTTLLVRQALALQMVPTASTGASLVLENHNLLNIAMEESDLRPTTHRGRSAHNRAATIQGSPSPNANHPLQISLPEMLARGLIGDGLGINKTLMTAVSELTRNIPDLASSLVRSPNALSPSLPLVVEQTFDERSRLEHSKQLETVEGTPQVASRDRRLGESLTWILDTLMQDETEAEDITRLKLRKQSALETLCYIRDVLVGDVIELEEDRLVEAGSRKGKIPQGKSVAVNQKVVDSKNRVSRSLAKPSWATLLTPAPVLPSGNHVQPSLPTSNPSLVEGIRRPPAPSSKSKGRQGTDKEATSGLGMQDPLGVLR